MDRRPGGAASDLPNSSKSYLPTTRRRRCGQVSGSGATRCLPRDPSGRPPDDRVYRGGRLGCGDAFRRRRRPRRSRRSHSDGTAVGIHRARSEGWGGDDGRTLTAGCSDDDRTHVTSTHRRSEVARGIAEPTEHSACITGHNAVLFCQLATMPT